MNGIGQQAFVRVLPCALIGIGSTSAYSLHVLRGWLQCYWVVVRQLSGTHDIQMWVVTATSFKFCFYSVNLLICISVYTLWVAWSASNCVTAVSRECVEVCRWEVIQPLHRCIYVTPKQAYGVLVMLIYTYTIIVRYHSTYNKLAVASCSHWMINRMMKSYCWSNRIRRRIFTKVCLNHILHLSIASLEPSKPRVLYTATQYGTKQRWTLTLKKW